MDVVKVSAADFQRNIGRYQDMALVQPVAVTRNGRESTIMISADEYRRLKRRDREVFAIGETPHEVIEAVRTTTMDARHEHLNDLVADWTP